MTFKTTCSTDLPLPKLLRRCDRFIFIKLTVIWQCTVGMLLLPVISSHFLLHDMSLYILPTVLINKNKNHLKNWNLTRQTKRDWVFKGCLIIVLYRGNSSIIVTQPTILTNNTKKKLFLILCKIKCFRS